MEKEDQQIAFLALKINSVGMTLQEAKHSLQILRLVGEIQDVLIKVQKMHTTSKNLKIQNVEMPLETCKFELIRAFVGFHKIYTDPEAKKCLIDGIHDKLAQIRARKKQTEEV